MHAQTAWFTSAWVTRITESLIPRLQFERSGATNYEIRTTSDALQIGTQNASFSAHNPRFTLLNNGNIGIGTTSPTQRLDIDGKIRMRTQTVSGDGDDIVATKWYVDSRTWPWSSGSGPFFVKLPEYGSYGFNNCGITSDKDLYCWGYNLNGVLWNWFYHNNHFQPIRLNLDNVDKVYTWYHSSCALLENGDVYCWGNNIAWSLGIGASIGDIKVSPNRVNITNVIQLTTWNHGWCALRSDWTIWCWWSNASWQLWNGNNINSAIPVQVNWINNATKISSNIDGWQWIYSTVCALRSNGTIWCWGYNAYGMLGNGTNVSSNIPVQFGNHTNYVDLNVWLWHAWQVCGIRSNRDLWCAWYSSNSNMWDGTNISKNTPVFNIANVQSAHFSKSSYAYSPKCVILTDATVRCVWQNAHWTLWTGSMTPATTTSWVQPLWLTGITDLFNLNSGYNYQTFLCAKNNSGRLWCWWWGGHSNIWNIDTITPISNNPTPREILYISWKINQVYVNWWEHYWVTVITDDGELYCWWLDWYSRCWNSWVPASAHVPVPARIHIR